MSFLVACKNEEDPVKNEGARVVKTTFIDFSDAQRQFTLKSVIESCRNSNSSELLWLVLLPARMKIIQKLGFYSGHKISPIISLYRDFSRRSRAANS